MDFSAPSAVAPLHINSWSAYSGAGEVLASVVSTPATLSWPSANKAVYIPLTLPWPYLIKRVFWVNGTTASSNVDLGIYSLSGALLASTGSTAQSGASALQYTTLATPLLLTPGRYYLALACSGTTSRLFGGNPALVRSRMAGILEQAAALPLPSAMTPAALSAAGLPLCGITRTDSGF